MLRLRVGGHEPAERLALAEATQARDVRPEPRHEHGPAHVVQVGGRGVVGVQLREQAARAVGEVAPQLGDVLEGGGREEVARGEAVAPLRPAVERAHQSDVVGGRASRELALGLVGLALLRRAGAGARGWLGADAPGWGQGWYRWG